MKSAVVYNQFPIGCNGIGSAYHSEDGHKRGYTKADAHAHKQKALPMEKAVQGSTGKKHDCQPFLQHYAMFKGSVHIPETKFILQKYKKNQTEKCSLAIYGLRMSNAFSLRVLKESSGFRAAEKH